MRRFVLSLALASVISPAMADDAVCVPRATLDRIAAYLGGQPWRDVAPIMDVLRQIAAHPRTCPDPTPAPPPPEPASK